MVISTMHAGKYFDKKGRAVGQQNLSGDGSRRLQWPHVTQETPD